MMTKGDDKDIFAPLPHGDPRPFRVQFGKDDLQELKTKLDLVRWGPEDGLLPKGNPKQDEGLLPTPGLLKRLVEEWKSLDFAKVEKDMSRCVLVAQT